MTSQRAVSIVVALSAVGGATRVAGAVPARCEAHTRSRISTAAEVKQSEQDLVAARTALESATAREATAKAARDKALEDLAQAAEADKAKATEALRKATEDAADAQRKRAAASVAADCAVLADDATHHDYDLSRTFAFNIGVGASAAGGVDGLNRVGLVVPSLQWRDGMFLAWEFAFIADSTQLLEPRSTGLDPHHNWGVGGRARVSFGRDAAFFLSAGTELLLRGQTDSGHGINPVAIIGQIGARFRIAQSGGPVGAFGETSLFAEPWLVPGSPGLPVAVLFGGEVRFGVGVYQQARQVSWTLVPSSRAP
jgi:hypothetical protein